MISESSLQNLKPVEKGEVRNPLGRPLGGRTLALNTLDRMMRKAENQRRLEEDLQAAFDDSPRKFFLTFIMPLLPREAQAPERQAQRLILSFAEVPVKEEKVIEVEEETKKGE